MGIVGPFPLPAQKLSAVHTKGSPVPEMGTLEQQLLRLPSHLICNPLWLDLGIKYMPFQRTDEEMGPREVKLFVQVTEQVPSR